MKIDKVDRNVNTTLQEQFQSSAINASAHMFNLLSRDQYSDPIKAVLRELGSNAIDSHIRAGCADKPFRIHLPTPIKPEFIIRDFGTGISSENMPVFMSYGFSDKQQTNDEIGGFGLGSKTPYACTDAYTVTSWQDNVKCVYAAFKNEDGIPGHIKVSEEITDEPNGLEVRFAVEDSPTQQEWSTKAVEVFQWFSVYPDGLPQVKEPIQFLIKEDRFALEENREPATYSNSARVMIGPIEYRVAYNSLPDNIRYNQEHALLADHRATFFFDIGELSVTPSRETLLYNNKTIQALKQACLDAYPVVKKYAETKLNNIDTIWRYRYILQSLKHSTATAYATKNIRSFYDTILSNSVTLYELETHSSGRWGQPLTTWKRRKITEPTIPHPAPEKTEVYWTLDSRRLHFSKAIINHSVTVRRGTTVYVVGGAKAQVEHFLSYFDPSSVFCIDDLDLPESLTTNKKRQAKKTTLRRSSWLATKLSGIQALHSQYTNSNCWHQAEEYTLEQASQCLWVPTKSLVLQISDQERDHIVSAIAAKLLTGKTILGIPCSSKPLLNKLKKNKVESLVEYCSKASRETFTADYVSQLRISHFLYEKYGSAIEEGIKFYRNVPDKFISNHPANWGWVWAERCIEIEKQNNIVRRTDNKYHSKTLTEKQKETACSIFCDLANKAKTAIPLMKYIVLSEDAWFYQETPQKHVMDTYFTLLLGDPDEQ